MKKIFFVVLAAIALPFAGCKKDAFLREKPEDFLTIDNAFLNAAQFRTGLNYLYYRLRENYILDDGDQRTVQFGSGADINFSQNDQNVWTNYSYLNGNAGWLKDLFNRQYEMINNANNILKQSENPDVKWASNTEKLQIQAEARFFRAWGYRFLSEMWGDMPLITEPVTVPNLAYSRDPREKVYAQCVEDFKFAAENLPKTTSEVGKLVSGAAYHFLSEMYIALADERGGADKSLYQASVDAASKVINSGDYRLMTSRFGYRSSIPGKDAFWDMFQMTKEDGTTNYSYQGGNKESLFIIHLDKFKTGGLPPQLSTRSDQERQYWPAMWGYTKFGFTGVAYDWMGRGVAWVRPTSYFLYDLWAKSGPEDTRNAEWNINRVLKVPNPNGTYQDLPDPSRNWPTAPQVITTLSGATITVQLHPGDTIRKDWLVTREDTMQRWYPRVMKMGSDWHYTTDPSNSFVQDYYVARLAETYLLRAEAYLKLGDLSNAAADINTVRARSNAKPVAPGNVDIDYILDERGRELYGEELRTLTLCRLKLYNSRTKRFGYSVCASTIDASTLKNNLFPIPQSVIDANYLRLFPQN
ncbi:RagB/SusD family nutrient uptake outer membrane protein [Flavisolibacter ginsenosidimutans]|uniref:RagB/SusD family nutrient uptake outer membrane protein n=1 Tax=Flavisolibacter ginsenosidimutans TaxID=661481 RepID=A0A5B8UJH9_9BACT|nr:RagB/SusD family nutrient uptake outer membrane protein [Flavisolibacter ginsenosidimutans]QEC56299.1 RagB/SusD family nutrient uptake outer membrane protein [Flavisolibacter ginsenosidimutans]